MSQETIESAAESSMGAHDEAMVKVRDLKTYYDNSGLFNSTPVKAVDGVSFDIRPGETLGLVGESGCGKTTLGRTLLQLEEATDGDIRFDGTDITTLGSDELQTWRRNAQMVFQDPQSSLNDRMTIGEIIREPLDVHDWKTPRERNQRVKELLSTVGLQREHYYRYPHQFSGGQRQRISIARTLALEPDFVVLDEPVSALDVSVQAEIINLLEDLQEEFGLTYLFIAHDLSVVRHICDRVAVMYLGNIMEIGPTEELFSNPSNPYTHSLLSAIPEPDPTVDRDRITLQGTPPNPRYPPAGCPFSTRCPARIRPPNHQDLDDELWMRLNALKSTLAERKRAERSIRERVRAAVGKDTRFGTIDETYDELFSDVKVPSSIESVLDRIATHAENHEESEAIDLFHEEFGSVCEREEPSYYTVGDDADEHRSYCHRHDDDYREPGPVLDDRHR
ncbi:ABC transporter ATP-binding protein [Natronolimnobius baerhuensis]|uniref:Peptide ABC transporter ATP-binding protein n=1 Tax=Natronolimnobius baerhuensis TaxID=253108 RepID=A0A202E8Z8_9EURY|nr:ABC transporter ATP-binding protein [Natronolimnobius baerhuensis]OVE84628.1 peptide ABC transporter ATP-binding protein [Natronolimnobius baerhuensis]